MTANLDPASASAHLRDLGFVSHPGTPGNDDPGLLLVAIRPQPTGVHFDPEELTYWVTAHERGRKALIDRTTPMPLSAAFSWGTLRVIDRFGIDNEWVSCGGELEAGEVDGSTICVFRSDVPILRQGGHSQLWDHGAANLVGFFGRLKVAIDFRPGFEALLSAATPRVRFAAFVADLATRYRSAPMLSELHPELWRLTRAEETRMRSTDPTTWQAGLALNAAAGLDPAGAAPQIAL